MNATQETAQAFAQELYESFETKTRDDGSVYVTCPGESPARELVQNVHFTCFEYMFPNDWVYQSVRDICEGIAENNESLDSLLDVYTHDLIEWASNPSFRMWVEEAMEQEHYTSLDAAITAGQYAALTCIAYTVESWIESHVEGNLPMD